jgi:uncharacterized membrane protein YagU involved in acid resistance
MDKKVNKSIVGGILGTAVMSLVMYGLPVLGMPKMSPPDMLAAMLGVPLVAGWIMHFAIGIVFALGYTYLCKMKDKVKNIYVKGAIFGIIVFILAQVMMGIMGAILPMPTVHGPVALVMTASIIGHIIYGIVVVRTIGDAYCANNSCEKK